MMSITPSFEVRIGRGQDDLRAAQRLRYDVFVAEMGGDGPLVDHEKRLERDRFDDHADHLLLFDRNRLLDDQVVGVYRLMTREHALAAGQFYCADEYDLTLLTQSDKRLLELGRSCLHPDYRGGAAMVPMWAALADYVSSRKINILFGVASFPCTDVAALAAPLSLLHARHLAPERLRVTALPKGAHRMDIIAPDQIDRVTAMRDTPALIKAYLRLGGVVGDGAFVDENFNTVDVCLILATDAVTELQRSIYAKGAGLG